MGLTTVLRDYGTEILNAIRECDVQKLKFILEKTLRSDAKIAKLCVTDIKHKPTKKFACPLILAARQEDSRIMKYMMEKGTDPNFVHHTIFSSKRREIVTALHIAVDLGFYNTAEVLLNANGDSNIYDHSQETPLHIAVKKADHTMTRLLLSKGADPSIVDRKGNAALHIATLYGHLQMVRTLLKYDADIYQKGQWDAIPPHIAAKEGHIHLLQLFCSKDIGNINIMIPCYVDRREKAPIHLAAENGHAECLLVLLDQFDAEVNLKDSDGNTALHCVVLHPFDNHRMRDKEYFTESARVLINFRVSVNEKNIFGDTALHFAAMNHYHRIVELLLDMGANPFLENEDGLKPVDTVPDSDPVTKQILKMAMARGRQHTGDSTMDTSMTPRSGRHMGSMGGFERSSKSNISHRSGSSMSSFYAGDPRGHKSRSRSQVRESRKSKGHDERRSRSVDLVEQNETPSLHENSRIGDDEASLVSKADVKVPVYTKVHKKEQDKPRSGKQGSKSKLNYDQREWEEFGSSVMNDDDSSVFMQEIVKPTSKRKSQSADPPQPEIIATPTKESPRSKRKTSSSSKSTDNISKKNKKNKARQPSVEKAMDLDTPINIDPVPAPRRINNGEVVYENLPPAQPQPPPLPPRRGRPGMYNSQDQLLDQGEIQGEYREENGVQVHTVPGKPSTIEVQYKGGPITISVDTPKDYYQESDEDTDSESEEEKPKPVKHRKQQESSSQQKQSPKGKKRDGHKLQDYREKQSYKSDEGPRSPKHKSSSRRSRKSSDDQPEIELEPSYYNPYYDQNNVEKKPKTKPKAKPRNRKYYEVSESFDQTMEDQENTTLDVSGMSMMSTESQPELVKRIIQMKVAEITDETKHHHKGSRTNVEKHRVQGWLGQDANDDDDDEDENILDSDEWQSAEEDLEPFPEVTPLKPTHKPRNQQSGEKDAHVTEQNTEQPGRKVPSSPKHDPHKFLPNNQPMNKLKDEEKKTVSPLKKKDIPIPTKPKPTVHIRTKPASPVHRFRADESTSHDDEVSVSPDDSPNTSPQLMSFKEKLAWARKNENQETGSPTGSPKPTPKKAPKPSQKAPPQAPKWKMKPGPESLVVENVEDRQYSETTSDDRSREGLESGSRDGDGDDEQEDDSSAFSDMSKKLLEKPGMYYSQTTELDIHTSYKPASSARDSTKKSPSKHGKPQKSNEPQEANSKTQDLEDLESYEGSPFAMRKFGSEPKRETTSEAFYNQSASEQSEKYNLNEYEGMMDYDSEPFADRHRSQSGDGTSSHRDVSPVSLNDVRGIPRPLGARTPDSVQSEGRGLGLKVTGNVPKAYKRQERSSARRAFMLAPPARIESSSDASDVEMYGSKGSLTDLSVKDRGKLWAEPMLKPAMARSPSGLSGTSPKPEESAGQSSKSDDASEDSSPGKNVKLLGGYIKPYKSFGKIEVKTDLIDEAMLNASIPEDPESLSDLEPFDEGPPLPESEPPPPSAFPSELLTPETPKSGGFELTRPEAIKMQDFDSEPSQRTTYYEKTTVVETQQFDEVHSPSSTNDSAVRKQILTNTNLSTTTQLHLPQIDALKAEHMAPTDDLSFGDSTFDLDDLVTQNSQIEPPSELPPPPPELMDENERQKVTSGGPEDQQPRNTAYVEEVEEHEVEAYMKKEKKAKKEKKSKTRKSQENLTEIGNDSQEAKIKGKKTKKKKPKDKQVVMTTETTKEESVSSSQIPDPQENTVKGKIELETYEDEPSFSKPRTIQGSPALPTGTHRTEGATDSPQKTMDDMMEYEAEPGSGRPQPATHLKNLDPDLEKPDQSMTDIEVAQITDAAEARRRSRELARAKRQWHKNQRESRSDSEAAPDVPGDKHQRAQRQDSAPDKANKPEVVSTEKDQASPWRKVTPSPTQKRVTPSPNTYTIVVEGGAEITTSRGNLPSGKPHDDLEAFKVDEQEQGALLSFGSKREKKKKMRKSTENLLEDGTQDLATKKKKKKKMGSRDDLSQSETGEKKKKKKKKRDGSIENLAAPSQEDTSAFPSARIQHVPDDPVVVSEVWKEAMEGQPLASSETVYDTPQKPVGQVPTSVKKKGAKKKRRKSSGSDQSSDVGHHDDLVKRAAVPQVRKPFDTNIDDPEDDPTTVPPTLQLSDAHKAAMVAAKEAKRKEKALLKLSKGIQLKNVGSEDDFEMDTWERERSPRPGERRVDPRTQHAINLRTDDQPMLESDEDIPAEMRRKAVVPKKYDAPRDSYTDSDSSTDSSAQNKAPVIGLSAAQKAQMISTRESRQGKAKTKKHPPKKLDEEEIIETTLQEQERTVTYEKPQTTQRPRHAMDLNKPSNHLQMIDDDILPGNLVNRAVMPMIDNQERYDLYDEDDDFDEDIGEDMEPVLNIGMSAADKAALKKSRASKRQDEVLRSEKRHQEEDEEVMRGHSEDMGFDELSGPPRPGNVRSQPPRSKYAVKLNQQSAQRESAEEDSSSEDLVQHAKVPYAKGKSRDEYGTNIDDYDEDISEEMGQVPVIGLGEAQKAAMMKAREAQQQKAFTDKQNIKNRPSEIEDNVAQSRNQHEQHNMPSNVSAHVPNRPKHAIKLTQDGKHREEESDSSSSEQYIQHANVPTRLPHGGMGQYKVYEDDNDVQEMSDVPVMNTHAAGHVSRDKTRQEKRQKQKEDKRRQLMQKQAEDDRSSESSSEEEMAQDVPTAGAGNDVPPKRPQHAMDLNQPQMGAAYADDEPAPEHLIKRAQITPKRKKSFETNLDDFDPYEGAAELPVLGLGDSQKAAMASIREAKKQQQLQMEKQRALKKHMDLEAELQRQEEGSISSESSDEEEILENVPESRRPQHAIHLNQRQQDREEYNDDEPVPESMIRRAQIKSQRKKSFETNLDDFDPDDNTASLPILGLGDSQKATMASIREAKRQKQIEIDKQQALKEQQENAAEMKRQQEVQRLQEIQRQLELKRQAQAQTPKQPAKPSKPKFAMKLDQPQNKYQDVDNEELPEDFVRRAQVPLPQDRTQSFETNIDDIEIDQDTENVPSKSGAMSDKEFKNAAFAALRQMQDGNKPRVSKKPEMNSVQTEFDEMHQEEQSNFSRNQLGRVSRGRMKKGPKPGHPQGGKEIYIDGPPELIGEDALPPGGDVDAQLKRDLAALGKEAHSTSPIMSELWKDKKNQESEMQLMLQSIQDPSELEPNFSREDALHDRTSRGGQPKDPKAFRGRLPPPPAGTSQQDVLPSPENAAMTSVTNMNTDQQQSPQSSLKGQRAPGPYRPQQSPIKSDRRPPKGPSLNDSQSSMQESPQSRPPRTLDNRIRARTPEGPMGPARPHSSSEGRPYEYRQRSASEGRPPQRQPIRRKVRKPYPEGDRDSFNQGNQSDSEALKHRRGKTISFYGDYRSDSEVSRRRDRAPKMKPSLSLEEAAWKQIRQDMDQQPKLQAHKVIKRKGDGNINYTRGIYRPTPVYWRGSQRSLANTSRYDDSELISQLWNERHQSMNTESEGEPYDEDVSYDANALEDPQYRDDGQQRTYFEEESRVRSVSMYDMPPPVPSSEPPYDDRYFPGAFHPVGPPKKVTIMDNKRKKRKEQIDQPPKMINPGPVDFNKYGATAKLWMEQVDRSDTQKSKTMYLSTLRDGQPPPQIAGNLPTDDHPTEGSQWVIARGRSLQQRKAFYDEQQRSGMGGDFNPASEMDPGKQMLLFFKIGENWKDLSWVLFEGLQSDGETLRMLKEIQHRHPDKVNDQVHDMMHRWWKKKGASATIEELQKALEFLKMAYVEEEYMNQRGIFSDTEPEHDPSTASEDDAEVNRLIHDYKNRSLNASYDGPHQVSISPSENNNTVNTGVLLKKLEEATIEHIPAKIHRLQVDSNRNSLQRSSLTRPDSGQLDFDASGDGSHQHSFIIVQPQLKSSDYKHETNM